MKDIKVLGIDLAKDVFQLHGTNANGKCVLRKRLSRAKLPVFVAQLKSCLIGMEACLGAHYWARTFEKMGHTVKIMAPKFVKPYIMSNKNDPNDTRGIAEAVTRPDMKFVAVKSIEQQDVLLLHRARELALKQKTAQANQIRGLLIEFGITIPQGFSKLKTLLQILEDNQERLTERSIIVFTRLYEQFKNYDGEVEFYDQKIAQTIDQNDICKEIMKIEGVGPITASAFVATIGDAKVFKRGREVSAWIGLVPKQHSSGNTIRLSGVGKRGDSYLRKLLVHGARSVINNCEKKTDKRNKWIADKKHRLGYNKAAVALANKNARIIWAIMATGECYRRSTIAA
ncbi:MAG: IS110 family transposase [Nanoarchaeota archaeon]